MWFRQYRLLSLKQLLINMLFYNNVWKLISLQAININENAVNLKINSALKNLENLVNLPKNCVFTADEIVKNTDLYLAGQLNEDVYLNGTQLIQKYGYEVEEHHVTTNDGYILALYRIPGNGRVVFLMHGIINSFVDWLTAGPDQGLAYVLAAQGYDVWMGNARGNTYSKKNDHLSASDPEFWDFSFDEIGSIDLSITIDYVLAKTGKQKLTYIGFSQGTTTFFVLCSTKPEYNDKIDFMVALAAIAYLKHIPNPIFQIAAQDHGLVYILGRALGLNDIAPDNVITKALTLTLCGDSCLASITCQNIVFLLAGFDYCQVNYKQLPVIYNHVPSGSSLKQIEHYLQLVNSGYFRKYDYGVNQNLEKYESDTPPSYPIDKISVPIAIFQSQGDWLVSTIDVDHLRRKLKNVVDYYEIPLHSFNHLDYLWAKDVKKLVYDKVLNLIKEH